MTGRRWGNDTGSLLDEVHEKVDKLKQVTADLYDLIQEAREEIKMLETKDDDGG